MQTPTTPRSSSRRSRQALAGHGRRSNGIAPSENAVAESEDLIYSLIEQPCPDPRPKTLAQQHNRPMPTVQERPQERPTDDLQELNAREPASSNKVSSFAHRVKTFFRPGRETLPLPREDAQPPIPTDRPISSASSSRRGGRHLSRAVPPKPNHHPSHQSRLPSSRHDAPRSIHSLCHEPYSSPNRHGSQSKHSSRRERSETPIRTSHRHPANNTATISHNQLEALGENLAEVVGDEFLDAFGDFAPKLLKSIQGVVDTATRSYKNDLAKGLAEQRHHVKATLGAGLSDLYHDTSHQLAHLAATTTESHANTQESFTKQFETLKAQTLTNHAKIMNAPPNPAFVQAMQDAVRAVVGVPPHMTLVEWHSQLPSSQPLPSPHPVAGAPVVVEGGSPTQSSTSMNQADRHARADLASVGQERDQARKEPALSQGDTEQALIIAELNMEVNELAHNHERNTYAAAISKIKADAAIVVRAKELELQVATAKANDAAEMANLNLDIGDALIAHERNVIMSAISQFQSKAASDAQNLRFERARAHLGEQEALHRASGAMDLVDTVQDTGNHVLDHERATASAAASRMQTNAASAAALLRHERTVALARAEETLNHLDDVINTFSNSQETVEAGISHERGVFGETVSRMRTTATAEGNSMRFGRDVRHSMLETTQHDLDAAKEDLQNKTEDLTNKKEELTNVLNLQTSIDHATLSTMSAATSEMKRKYDLSGVYKDIEARAKLFDSRAQISEKDREIFNLHADSATSERRVRELDRAIDDAGEEIRRGYLESAMDLLMKATAGGADKESDSEEQESVIHDS
ncbi:hypothetical protein FB567DRAFT_598352 [Paraphoma chrysanthemicola]|uniref:Uncharacterized protein n=1 Tax=Paraphoma chrysanthemicola TaxID=798071 RepID=A0A8K0VSG5_9PLEO|nr:hypothetical protein FB567DRAFT_598352 [Paraphoma chrysanthemicola]